MACRYLGALFEAWCVIAGKWPAVGNDKCIMQRFQERAGDWLPAAAASNAGWASSTTHLKQEQSVGEPAWLLAGACAGGSLLSFWWLELSW